MRYNSNMWALKNKQTGKLVTEGEMLCIPGDHLPALYLNRQVARLYKSSNHTVVKVGVSVRAAA